MSVSVCQVTRCVPQVWHRVKQGPGISQRQSKQLAPFERNHVVCSQAPLLCLLRTHLVCMCVCVCARARECLCACVCVCERAWERGSSRCASCTRHTGLDAHMQRKALTRLPTRTHACSRGAHPLCDELGNIHQADLYKRFGTNVHLQVWFSRVGVHQELDMSISYQSPSRIRERYTNAVSAIYTECMTTPYVYAYVYAFAYVYVYAFHLHMSVYMHLDMSVCIPVVYIYGWMDDVYMCVYMHVCVYMYIICRYIHLLIYL